jgi:nucleotide-binding universal stress UspA family protein
MKVLLGIGGNEDSFRALARTVERTEDTGDDLTVAVLEHPGSSVTPEEIERRVRETVSDSTLSVADDPDGEGVVVRHLSGDAGPRLVEVADREAFDRIVLGGGERSPMGKIAVGEIAEFVLLNARTSVTLVR